jgi:hypothetical protein
MEHAQLIRADKKAKKVHRSIDSVTNYHTVSSPIVDTLSKLLLISVPIE